MEIKKEFIGCKVWSPALSRYVKIEAEKGEMYLKLGIMEIYEFEKPNLVKKINVKNSKKELGDGCGRLMWLAWGGDAGIEWAQRKLEQIKNA